MNSSEAELLHVRRDDEERVHPLHLAQVALRDPVHVARDLLQRAHQVLRRAGDHRRAAVGRVLAVARDHLDQDPAQGVGDPGDEQQDQPDRRAVVVAVAAAAEEAAVEREARDQRGEHREEAGERHRANVAVLDVRQLVREDGLDLRLLEPAHQARRDGDGGVLRDYVPSRTRSARRCRRSRRAASAARPSPRAAPPCRTAAARLRAGSPSRRPRGARACRTCSTGRRRGRRPAGSSGRRRR